MTGISSLCELLWSPGWWIGDLGGHADDGDSLYSRPTLPQGAAGSRSADHGEAVFHRLYSGCTARRGQDNRMLHKATEFLLPSVAPLYTNTPGELGHLVAHT